MTSQKRDNYASIAISKLMRVFLLGSVLFLWAGCGPKVVVIPTALSRGQLIEKYNRNVAAVPSFKANVGQWKVMFPKEDGKIFRHGDIGGKMYYYPGQGDERAWVYLQGSASVFQPEAFVVASNDIEYWAYTKVEKTGRWGKYAHLGKPCSQEMLINPQRLLKFIGLQPLPDDIPQPAYKILPDSYIIYYLGLSDDGYFIEREIIIDRVTNLARQIKAYDTQGQLMVCGSLSKYKPLGEAMLPGDITLEFPAHESYLKLKLDNFKVSDKKKDVLFIRSDKGIDDYQQIDKECEDEQY